MGTVSIDAREEKLTALEEIYNDVDDTHGTWIDTTEDTIMTDTMEAAYTALLETDDTEDSTEDTYTESERTAYETGIERDDSTEAEQAQQRWQALQYAVLVDGDRDAAGAVCTDPIETQEPAVPEVPAEILAAEELQRQAQALQEQFKAMQDQMKLLAEQAKRAQEKAAEAKAKAPILITPELRARLDVLAQIVALDEQGRAKAITNGLLFVRIASDKAARKDTGVIRNVPHIPSSSGVVELNHHGAASTNVNGTDKEISQERIDEIQRIVSVLNTIPTGLHVSDRAVAEQAHCADVRLATKTVWHVRDARSQGKLYRGVNVS